MGSAEAGGGWRPPTRIPLAVLRLAARSGLSLGPRLLRRAGVWDQRRWAGAPLRETRAVWTGSRLRLDLSDYHQRGAYFYGRLLDLATTAVLASALGPGDDCIDVGANIGMLTLAAAAAVSPSGRVLSIEPNPDVLPRLRWHVEANRLTNVSISAFAASDRDAAMPLSVPPTGNTGAGSLGTLLPRHQGRTSAVYEVRLRRGDDIVREAWQPRPQAALVIKIDVEGHETAALRGLSSTIESRRPPILAEVNPYMLSTNGSSVEELLGLLAGWGYRAYAASAPSRGVLGPAPRLTPLPRDWRPQKLGNAVFIPAELPADSRTGWLVRSG